MNKLTLYLCAALVAVSGGVSAQLVRPAPIVDPCPEPDSWTCQMWPYLCEDCEEERTPLRRVIPTLRPVPTSDPFVNYEIPRTVGVAQIAYSAAWPFNNGLLDHFTTKELLDELTFHGISAVRLWLSVPYNDGMVERHDGCGNTWISTTFEDMREVWGHPQINTFVVIFTDPAYANWEPGCQSVRNISWPNEPTYEIATFLYEHFGHLDKTIIIANPETDNLWRGYDCVEPTEAYFDSFWGPDRQEECFSTKTLEECVYELSMARFDYTRMQIEKRQIAVERARAENPDAALRIYTSMTINVFTPERAEKGKYLGKFALRDMEFEHDPDFIGASVWDGAGISVAEAIRQVRYYTGYPAKRIFLDQAGASEKRPGRQYPVIYARVEDAFNSGVNLALVWMWRQTWHHFNDTEDSKGLWLTTTTTNPKWSFEKALIPLNKGMWNWITTEGWVEWGEPTSGLGAIYDLNRRWEYRPSKSTNMTRRTR